LALTGAAGAASSASNWSKLFTVDARVFVEFGGKGLRWTKWPKDGEIFASYPDQAYREHLHGSAIVDCVATASGTLTDCVVVEEAPADKGFGAASVAVVSQFEFGPVERITPAMVGRKLRVPVVWQTRRTRATREVWERGS
jgi:TonB family protein